MGNMKLLLIVESTYDFLTFWYIFYIFTEQKEPPEEHTCQGDWCETAERCFQGETKDRPCRPKCV